MSDPNHIIPNNGEDHVSVTVTKGTGPSTTTESQNLDNLTRIFTSVTTKTHYTTVWQTTGGTSTLVTTPVGTETITYTITNNPSNSVGTDKPQSTESIGTLNNESAPPPSSGLSMGAKIGIGVAVPILFILIGAGLFLFYRLKTQRRLQAEKSGVEEVMIIGGKQGHLDEDQSSGPSGPAGYTHPGPPPQASDGHMYAPPPMQGPSGYEQGVAGAPVVAPTARRSPVDEDELMNRPVSPVHDDLLTEDVGAGASVPTGGRPGPAVGGSIRDRGSPTLDDDREMQWILEEERKAKERREQQGRLPHVPQMGS